MGRKKNYADTIRREHPIRKIGGVPWYMASNDAFVKDCIEQEQIGKLDEFNKRLDIIRDLISMNISPDEQDKLYVIENLIRAYAGGGLESVAEYVSKSKKEPPNPSEMR